MALLEEVHALSFQHTHRHCRCWKVTRDDGAVVRVTTHNASLDIVEDTAAFYAGSETAQTYNPAGAFLPSARQHGGQLADKNAELRGILAAAAVTLEDVWAGRWGDAEIYEYKIDWMYPWLGPLRTSRYYVNDVNFDTELWKAELEGLTRFLKQSKGRVYGRHCDAEVFDARCALSAALWTVTGSAVVDTLFPSQPRTKFTVQDKGVANMTTPANFNDGEVLWTSGFNTDLIGEIKLCDNRRFLSPDFVVDIELYVPLPYAVALGNLCTIKAGCDKLPGHGTASGDCKDKFANLINFRAFQFLPGNDEMLKTP